MTLRYRNWHNLLLWREFITACAGTSYVDTAHVHADYYNKLMLSDFLSQTTDTAVFSPLQNQIKFGSLLHIQMTFHYVWRCETQSWTSVGQWYNNCVECMIVFIAYLILPY